jgi:heterodisulfide reductase subunit C
MRGRETNPEFTREALGTPAGKKALDCIQCGVCAGSCHARFAMDWSPMQVIKMVELGMMDDALSSSTIWICTSCYTCTSRCPRGIEIPLFMSTLKYIAIRGGIRVRVKKKLRFHRAFSRILKRYGRLNELLLTVSLLGIGPRGLLRNTRLGFRLWKRGKVRPFPSKVKQKAQIKAIFEGASKGGRAR